MVSIRPRITDRVNIRVFGYNPVGGFHYWNDNLVHHTAYFLRCKCNPLREIIPKEENYGINSINYWYCGNFIIPNTSNADLTLVSTNYNQMTDSILSNIPFPNLQS